MVGSRGVFLQETPEFGISLLKTSKKVLFSDFCLKIVGFPQKITSILGLLEKITSKFGLQIFILLNLQEFTCVFRDFYTVAKRRCKTDVQWGGHGANLGYFTTFSSFFDHFC